eukprot:5938913-Pyramimonas_sp.AAC.1
MAVWAWRGGPSAPGAECAAAMRRTVLAMRSAFGGGNSESTPALECWLTQRRAASWSMSHL